MNKRGDIPIGLLVLATLVLVVFAIFSFLGHIKLNLLYSQFYWSFYTHRLSNSNKN